MSKVPVFFTFHLDTGDLFGQVMAKCNDLKRAPYSFGKERKMYNIILVKTKYNEHAVLKGELSPQKSLYEICDRILHEDIVS